MEWNGVKSHTFMKKPTRYLTTDELENNRILIKREYIKVQSNRKLSETINNKLSPSKEELDLKEKIRKLTLAINQRKRTAKELKLKIQYYKENKSSAS